MVFIPKEYKLEEGKTAGDGCTEIACSVCKTKFAVPLGMFTNLGAVPVCVDCSDAWEKAQKELAAAKVKTDTTTAVSDVGQSTAAKAAQI